LVVLLIGGFKPIEGNSFILLAGGGLSGSFSSFALPPLDPGLAWSYRQSVSDATLTVIPEPSTGGLLFVMASLGFSRRVRH
jgi:hypothetical protein